MLRIVVTTLLALGIASSASPVVARKSPVTLPLTRHYNFTPGVTIPEVDKARFHALREYTRKKAQGGDGVYPVPATNTIVTYTTVVGVGTPPTDYTLLVDTGSSNTWVGAATPYEPSLSTVDTGAVFFIEYGSGLVLGELYQDTVVLGGSLTLTNQLLGGADLAFGFNDVDGILGIGPTDLTEGSTSTELPIPTVTDNAWVQGLLDTYEVGISYAPPAGVDDPNGELTFGGTDSSKYIGNIQYVPITATSPASEYVGIDQYITYGDARIPVLSPTSGITDTGTTLILLASDAYQAYVDLTGAELDETTGLLSITPAQYAALQSLWFTFGGVEHELIPNAQIWPRSLNSAIGGDPDGIYLVISNLGTPTGEGLDFIVGYTFLERWYSVYNTGNNSFGIAQTPWTLEIIN